MTRYTDNLWGDLVREHGATLAQADRPEPGRAPFYRRPQVIAGGTLALAVAGTALGFGLTAPGSTPAATGTKRVFTTAAYTITQNTNGSVVVEINQATSLPQANAKLTAIGIHEQVTIYMQSGPAATPGPVTCTPAAGTSGPTLKVLIGTNGTEVIKPGTTGDNTGVGTWSLNHCETFKTGDTGGTGSGNSGTG
jgi:hypothetical protein